MVDKGYTDAHVLVDSQRAYGVTIVGPVAEDPSWQARAGEGFDKSQFLVDWDRHVVICPAGKQSISWLPNTYPKNGMVWEARFARKDCTPCVYRSQCTKAKQEPRLLGCRHVSTYEALQAARQRQTTETFRRQYAVRAGIESTHEQAIRRCGLRRCRYLGQAKTIPSEYPAYIDRTPDHAVTVTELAHPLYGLTFPLVGVTTKQRLGRVCVVWLYPGVERVIPVTATDLAGSAPSPPSPCRLSVAGLDALLAVGASQADLSQEETYVATAHPPNTDTAATLTAMVGAGDSPLLRTARPTPSPSRVRLEQSLPHDAGSGAPHASTDDPGGAA